MNAQGPGLSPDRPQAERTARDGAPSPPAPSEANRGAPRTNSGDSTSEAAPQFQMVHPQRKRCRFHKNIPAAVRNKVTRAAQELKREHRKLFMADPKLKDRAARFLRSLLPPKPRKRGHPGYDSVTNAIRLRKEYARQYPGERPQLIWSRVYPEAIPAYSALNETEQKDARADLREHVRDRLRKRRRRARG